MPNTDLLIIQHVPFEGPGTIKDWAIRKNIQHTVHRIFENTDMPEPDEISGLVIMGGPMSANDDDVHPWIKTELSYIQACLNTGIPVMGVCLGAQLLARALGAKVYTAKHKEIGWFPVQFYTEQFPPSIRPDESSQKVFHWHGETFDLPSGCVRLASSQDISNQLFLYDENTMGAQFHIEMNAHHIQSLIEHCGDELSEQGPYIMNEKEIISEKADYLKLHKMLCTWLDYLFLPS